MAKPNKIEEIGERIVLMGLEHGFREGEVYIGDIGRDEMYSLSKRIKERINRMSNVKGSGNRVNVIQSRVERGYLYFQFTDILNPRRAA